MIALLIGLAVFVGLGIAGLHWEHWAASLASCAFWLTVTWSAPATGDGIETSLLALIGAVLSIGFGWRAMNAALRRKGQC